ncbi:fructosamine kinase family protein [Schaalia suimastitidis]|uniref:fructosamine kinase family protein n=1 Tax=Schaalia suimastitidis TaxID=121163 RepID=UPI00041DF3F7|nr:fructosamine kinase family protein [Schaalia suimastitidis]
MTFFRKAGSAAQINWEIAGLQWLADAQDVGSVDHSGAFVVPIVGSGRTYLEEPRLHDIGATPAHADAFGHALAYTHAAGASHWGAPPPRWSGDGWMGAAHLPLIDEAAHAPASWGTYYASYRILPYLATSPFTPEQMRVIERLCERLDNGDFEHDQPALLHGTGQQARLHGDLWGGNIMWTDRGAVLIDPAAQGGHAEEDLAQLRVFGTPYADRIIAAYHEASPLCDGWRERVTLHQMHMLMVHCHLFGGAYITETVSLARRYL